MTRRHDAPKGRKHRESLYDRDIPTPSHAERARTLVGDVGTATLCTAGEGGHPYGSFVTYGLVDGQPVLLVSALAEHTRNLLKDGRSSLLIAEPGSGDPLARGRVTLVCTSRKLEEGPEKDEARDAFLEAHPGASYYVDFKDFSLWKMEVSSIRYIGGYGRMSWVESADWVKAEPDPIAPSANRIIQHMNDDHGTALALMCRAYSKAQTFSSVLMTGVDRYGFEMSVQTEQGPRPVRVAFPVSISDSGEARTQLVALTRKAREDGAQSADSSQK